MDGGDFIVASFIVGWLIGAIMSYLLFRGLGKDFRELVNNLYDLNDSVYRAIHGFENNIVWLDSLKQETKNFDEKISKLNKKIDHLYDRVIDIREELIGLNNLLKEKFRWKVNVVLEPEKSDEK